MGICLSCLGFLIPKNDSSINTSMEVDSLVTMIVQNTESLEFGLSQLPESRKWILFGAVGTKLLERYDRTCSIDDINRAITMEEKAIELIPVDHPDRAACLKNLGNALQRRFERTGSMDDLDRAIVTNEQAVESTPVDHPDRADRLNDLGFALQSRFDRTGLMDDLNRAIVTNEQAIKSTPVDHPNRSTFLNNLGFALRSRFERTGSMDDLNRAIVTNEQAVEATPVDRPGRAACLIGLGISLQSRFERTGSMDDLDRAIVTNEHAVESTPVDHPERAGGLSNLGIALLRRFERTGSMNDLDRAIVTNEQAIESIQVDHIDRAVCLNNLGIALQRRFERTGSMDDLHRAIVTNEQAVESTPVDHPDRVAWLNNLGNALRNRFERTGSMDDLDRAIVISEQAVESIPFDHPDRAACLNNLGNALQRRFERTGSMDDLDRAIVTNEQAVESTPVDHPDRVAWLNNLGNALRGRFERTGLMDDLDRAILANEQAVESAPADHPDRAAWLNSLGNALRSRFEMTGSMNDLDHAIMRIEQAIESTPVDHPGRASRLNNLGIALQSRFERTESIDDLDCVIQAIEQAVKSTPVEHPNHAAWLNNLGNALQSRFEKTGSMDDLDRAIVTNERAVKSDTAAPSIRLKAAQSCADLLIGQKNYAQAKSILQAAVQLLPRVSPRQLRRSDQQFNISHFSHITSRAVSLCLENKDEPYESLELLEFGRGILANLQLEIRSDISKLAMTHPDLAQQFQELRDQIDPPLRNSGFSVIENPSASFHSASAYPSKSISERRSLLKQFEDLLQNIRSLEGFDNFLRGPSESELRSLAESGAIVVFNISDIRSDAFLITNDEIRTIHLPLLTLEDLEDLVKKFFNAINEKDPNRYRQAIRQMNDVLEGLWDLAVKSILEELGFTETPPANESWPRVYWIGSGLLSILPIHASGYHNSDISQTVLNRVISSYSPTVKSLAYAQERAMRADRVTLKEKALLVSMPTTPEEANLPFVKTEIRDSQILFSNASIDTKIIQNPMKTAMLAELSTHTIIHLACHGYMADDPSQSSLLLEDWITDPLVVSDLISLNIDSVKFAYLSACHTSTMRDFRLLDESINLSSAIQLSGYPSVVGSLWTVVDCRSAEVSRNVYEWILQERKFDCRRSAEGLHRAVRRLRDKTRVKVGCNIVSDPIVWAPFIHIGI